MPLSGSPLLSVVVPARNAAETLPFCLAALERSAAGRAQVIVVDDGSTDGTGELARAAGVEVIRHEVASGPARARNVGAGSAASDIVLFVDADVVIADDAVTRVLEAFEADADLTAVFGSYDDAPGGRTLVSDYRNLLHHFVHQSSRADSASFWAGCGAVRKAAFLAVGGFDERYCRPSIEDIELGGRFARGGYRVRLDKRLTGRHLKNWTLAGLVVVDVRDRAYPWASLMLRQGRIPADLNLQYSHRVSAALVWAGIACLTGLGAGLAAGWRTPVQAAFVVGFGAAVVATALLNRGFYRFLLDRRGIRFVAAAFVLHALYYAYASATFAWCWVHHHTMGAARLGEAVV